MSDLVKLIRESFVACSPKGRAVRSFRVHDDILPGDRERIADELERLEQENADLRQQLTNLSGNYKNLNEIYKEIFSKAVEWQEKFKASEASNASMLKFLNQCEGECVDEIYGKCPTMLRSEQLEASNTAMRGALEEAKNVIDSVGDYACGGKDVLQLIIKALSITPAEALDGDK